MSAHPQPQQQRTPWPFPVRPQPVPTNDEVRRMLGFGMTQPKVH